MGLRILLAVVGSSHSEAAVRLVANIPWPAGTSVHVLTVAPERWPYLGPNLKADHELAEVLAGMRQVDRAAAEAGWRGLSLLCCPAMNWPCKRMSLKDARRR